MAKVLGYAGDVLGCEDEDKLVVPSFSKLEDQYKTEFISQAFKSLIG